MSSTRRRRELWMDTTALPVRVLIVDDDEQARAAMGSLLATRDDLFFRAPSAEKPATLDGDRAKLQPDPRETSNPVAYFLSRIRQNQPIEDPLTGRLNVQVMEILDAARKSIKTGRAVELH